MIGKSIGLVDKESGQSTSLDWTNLVTLDSTSVVKMPFGPRDVESYEKNGAHLIINLKSGEVVIIQGFFTKFGDEDRKSVV